MGECNGGGGEEGHKGYNMKERREEGEQQISQWEQIAFEEKVYAITGFTMLHTVKS